MKMTDKPILQEANRDLHTGWVVSAGFTLVIILMLGGISAGLYTFSKYNEQLTESTTDANRKISLSFTMRDAIRDRVDILRLMLTTSDAFERDDLRMAFFNHASRYAVARAELIDLLKQDQEFIVLDELDEKATEVGPNNRIALKLLNQFEGVPEKTLQNAISHSILGHLSLFSELEKMLALQQKIAEEALIQAKSDYREAQVLAIIISLSATLIAIITAWLVIKRSSEKNEQLTFQASHDTLTQLPNRAAFERALAWILKESVDDESEHVLLLMDLDQFKIVNDTKGHHAGDLLLCLLSEHMQTQIRSSDMIARLGGDEFGVLLRYTSPHFGEIVANKIRKAVEEFEFTYDEQLFKVGISIGMTPFNGSKFTLEKLLSTTDTSCFIAKDAGRNRVHRSDLHQHEMSQLSGEMQWASRIAEAIDQEKFVLHGQIMHSMDQNAYSERTLIELLIRLPDDESGALIPPGQFLPAAERYGQMTNIDQWVVKRTLRWLSSLGELQGNIMVGVNIFGRSASDPKFANFLYENIVQSQIDPAALCFEITESVAVNNLAAASSLIKKIGKLGCSFALDDFGAGLSSFSYLRHLDVDYLKIDGSFIRHIEENATDRSLVESINNIGQTLGKKTIAEFVESQSSLKLLESMGLDFAQGFIVHKPEPLDQVEKILREGVTVEVKAAV